MFSQHLLTLFLGLFVDPLAAKTQLGFEFTGLDSLENQKVQRECGIATALSSRSIKKVLNGMNVTNEEFMNDALWMVSLSYQGKKSSATCGGVLISPRHVLTATHCLIVNNQGTTCGAAFRHKQNFKRTDVSKYAVRVFSRYGKGEAFTTGKTHEVKRVIFPASWTATANGQRLCSAYNDDTEDIAIYELKKPVALPTFVCLVNVDLPFKPLTSYGYGRTGLNKSMESKEPFGLKKHYVKDTDCDKDVYKGMRCLTHLSESSLTSSCKGDSGGPVVAKHYNRAYTVGVMTNIQYSCPDILLRKITKMKEAIFGSIHLHIHWACSCVTASNVMTSVPYYKNWICRWSGICVYGADPTKDRRPTAIWDYTGEKNIL